MLLNVSMYEIFTTALLGTLFSLLLAIAVAAVLYALGFRLFRTRKKAKRAKKEASVTASSEAEVQESLSEEELLVILSAAVAAALADENNNRFRVVSFRRI